MAVIRIQERLNGPDGANAIVSFDYGPEYPITIADPFEKQQEEDLEWYFEEHLRWPFLNDVRAQNAAQSVTTYGTELFNQVFANPKILVQYKMLLPTGLNQVQIEIAGSPGFHALHWEALRDPDLPHPLALQATIIRRNMQHQPVPATMRPSPIINLLVVIARPAGKRDVGYRTISRPLVEALHQAKLPVKIDILRPGTYQALENHLRATTEQYGAGYYHVIHFDVHGAILPYQDVRYRYWQKDIQAYKGKKAFLFLEGEKDTPANLIEAAKLATLLMAHQVPIVVLNACQSSKQVGESETSLASHLVQSGVQMALAMGYSVTVTAAKLLMTTLYQQLFEGYEIATAIRTARSKLYQHKGRQAYFNQEINLEDWMLPVVYQNQPQRLTPRPFTPVIYTHLTSG